MPDYQDRMKDYVPVNERIEQFYSAYPHGSLQSEIVELTDKRVTVRATAYRTPDDPRPGIGHSSLSIPGSTPYTRGSEIENAETSSWGRAIAALGFEVKRGVASAEEVRNKQQAGERSLEAPAKTPPATYRRDELAALMREHGLSHRDLEALADQVGITKGSTATPPQMDALIARIQLPPPDDDDLPEPIHQPSGAAGEPESVVPPRADPLPGLTEDEFADLQEGLWPRPGSDEYKALEPVKKAEARAFWQAQA